MTFASAATTKSFNHARRHKYTQSAQEWNSCLNCSSHPLQRQHRSPRECRLRHRSDQASSHKIMHRANPTQTSGGFGPGLSPFRRRRVRNPIGRSGQSLVSVFLQDTQNFLPEDRRWSLETARCFPGICRSFLGICRSFLERNRSPPSASGSFREMSDKMMERNRFFQ